LTVALLKRGTNHLHNAAQVAFNACHAETSLGDSMCGLPV